MSYIYAMSDIHGCLDAFEYALSLVDFSGDNKLILLCDYIHGPDDYGVLNKIMQLQNKYGSDKVIALLGNHEDMACDGRWFIGGNTDENAYDHEENDAEYLMWMQNLPRYHVEGNAIFVHAGIDEEAEELWEWGTDDYTFMEKYPAQTGRFYNDMKIIAGHIGTAEISGNPGFHDIYFDGESHYYIDGTVSESDMIPVLKIDTESNKYYRVTDAEDCFILPYEEENGIKRVDDRRRPIVNKKIYAVKNGRKIGIFNEWQKCFEQTDKYPNGEFRGFEYCGELAEEPETVPGSLRYAIKAAKEFLGDLVYLGESADCMEDVSWAEDGFLPFGNAPKSESPEFVPDKSMEGEADAGDMDEEPDEWLIGNRNAPDALGESWEMAASQERKKYWKIAEDMKKCVKLIKYGSVTEKKVAASDLKRHLERCLADMELRDLTVIYKGLKKNNAIGYDTAAVTQFVQRMANRYPKP